MSIQKYKPHSFIYKKNITSDYKIVTKINMNGDKKVKSVTSANLPGKGKSIDIVLEAGNEDVEDVLFSIKDSDLDPIHELIVVNVYDENIQEPNRLGSTEILPSMATGRGQVIQGDPYLYLTKLPVERIQTLRILVDFKFRDVKLKHVLEPAWDQVGPQIVQVHFEVTSIPLQEVTEIVRGFDLELKRLITVEVYLDGSKIGSGTLSQDNADDKPGY